MCSDMKQFLRSDVCLSCEGCCRFNKEKSEWRPKVTNAEIKLISEEKIASGERVEEDGYLNDKLCHGTHVCTFFNPEDSTCAIYDIRPFECRLYPFVLTKVDQAPAVDVLHGSADLNEQLDDLGPLGIRRSREDILAIQVFHREKAVLGPLNWLKVKYPGKVGMAKPRHQAEL